MAINILQSVVEREKEFREAMNECANLNCRLAIRAVAHEHDPDLDEKLTWEEFCDRWPTMDNESTMDTAVFLKLGKKGKPSLEWTNIIRQKLSLDEYRIRQINDQLQRKTKKFEKPDGSNMSKIY